MPLHVSVTREDALRWRCGGAVNSHVLSEEDVITKVICSLCCVEDPDH